ncbi:DoxX family protein [Brevibacillus choshinensis]|uniref:DoxX family protein n=1 Tax=Brevibacillus choshinensis TaxID=54911 RepID=A0ABX7FSI4_BRECH|nr:DoxX family protein [Brevibacillus choshinensis]QRG68669.1 DoxX family protein [Brevibacillus choshinensis]
MNTKTMQEVGALLVRVILGIVFINHGLDKFQALEGTAGFFSSLGIPGWMANVVASIELFGGILVLIGLGTRIVPLLFAWIMIVVMFVMPSERGFFTGNELHLSLLAMSVYLVLAGSPLLSVDKLLPIGQKKAEKAY